MTSTTNPRELAMTSQQLARAEEELKRNLREVAEQRKRAEREEAERAEREVEKKRAAEALAATLNRVRDGLWAAPLPKTLGGFAQVTTALQGAISEYRQAAGALGLPGHEQDRVVNPHPIMRVVSWLGLFAPATRSER